MRDLTTQQLRVLEFIRRFLARSGFPPTHAEIAAGLGFRSPNAATEHVRLLARKGALAIEPGIARGLRVVPSLNPARRMSRSSASPNPPARTSSFHGVGLPVIGEVAAGQPILATANVERVVEVDPALFRPRAHFLLRVRGDSMIEADIRPDDLLAVHRTPTVDEGAIAVVRLDDDVTVKRFRTRAKSGRSKALRGSGREVVLEPANSSLSPIVVDPAHVQVAIEGLVVGLLRTDLAAPLSSRRWRP